MAARAVCSGRFFYTYACMAADTLLMIGPYQTRANRLSFDKRLTVTTAALGRFLGDNAVVVTSLT